MDTILLLRFSRILGFSEFLVKFRLTLAPHQSLLRPQIRPQLSSSFLSSSPHVHICTTLFSCTVLWTDYEREPVAVRGTSCTKPGPKRRFSCVCDANSMPAALSSDQSLPMFALWSSVTDSGRWGYVSGIHDARSRRSCTLFLPCCCFST